MRQHLNYVGTIKAQLDALDSPRAAILVGFSSLLLVSHILTSYGVVGDYALVWLKQAEIILNGGTPYVDQWDNKTPLWQYLNVVIVLAGGHTAMQVALVIVNASTAYLLGTLALRHRLTRAPVLVGCLYLVFIGAMRGFGADPRPFASLALVAALHSRTATGSGAGTSVACLMHQYYGLTIPFVVIYHWFFGDGELTVPWLGRFASIGSIGVVLTYGSVLIFWGREALIASVNYSVLGLIGFLERGRATSDTVFRDPSYWYTIVSGHVIAEPVPVLILALAGLGFYELILEKRHRITVWLGGLSVHLMIPLAFDPADYYWIAPGLTIAILAGVGVRDLRD